MTARPALVVLLPLQPSARGNGLAMRCDLLVRACGVHHDVHLVVVPVAGRPPILEPSAVPASSLEVALAPLGDARAVGSWLADPTWRARLEQLAPLPTPVAAAPPRTVAASVAAHLAGRAVAGVVACRLSVALPALALAEQLSVPLVVDVDDDDEALERSLGRPDEAADWGRVAGLVLPAATAVLAASAPVAAAVGERHGVAVSVAPNAVAVPRDVLAAAPVAAGLRVLMVGNLTYGPNAEGARWLAEAVLPRLPPGSTVDLVGPADAAVAALAGRCVHVHGVVDDLTPSYQAADVVAVPLHHGSGTRLKLLEAFALGRPVVSTTVGAEGIDARPDQHLLVADDPAAFAAALVRAAEPATRDALVASARQLVAQTYDASAVADAVARLVLDALRSPRHHP